MPRRTQLFTLTLMVLMMGAWVLPVQARAPSPESPDMFTPEISAAGIDEFTYRFSFRLSDGTEAFLIRSRFGLTYMYQLYPSYFAHHFMWAIVGFYYSKTMLGRSIVQNITFDSLAFYPLWMDTGNTYHDLMGETPLFELTQSVSDGELIGGNLLIDPDASSRYVHLFGGTLTITGLTLILENGLTVRIGDITIEIIKHYNEDEPYPAEMESEEDLNYTSDALYITVIGTGVAPFVVLLDAAIGTILLGSTVTFIILIVLHLKGRIRLPFYKLGRLTSRSTSVIE